MHEYMKRGQQLNMINNNEKNKSYTYYINWYNIVGCK